MLDADRLAGRPPAAGSVAGGGVRVHYCHALLRPLAERVLGQARESLRRQVAELGFPAPLPDGGRGGGPELDVYLLDLGRGGRAQANEEPERPEARTACSTPCRGAPTARS